MPVVRTRSLTKYYGHVKGVKDVNLAVQHGEIFGFIGPNGAGKSTTIRMLMQLIYPTSGEIEILGEKVVGDHPELRRRIGYLPSEIEFYESLTGRQLLQFIANVYQRPQQHSIDAMAEELALDLSKRVRTYSLGNRKKLGIIQALMHNPELLILDEPTSGLDPLVKASFFNMLRARREKGATIFLSTHVLSEVEELCDRVGIIRDGALFQVAPVSDIPGRDRRTLKVKFARDGDLIEALNLRDIDPNVSFDGETHQFHVHGAINAILLKVAQHPIVDLTVEQPSIEEVFMEFYQMREPIGKANPARSQGRREAQHD